MSVIHKILIGLTPVIALGMGLTLQAGVQREAPKSGPTALVFSASFDGLAADQHQLSNGETAASWTRDEALVNLPNDGISGAGDWVPEGGYGCPTGSSITTAASRSGAAGDRGFRFCMLYNPTINPNGDGSNRGMGGGVNQGGGGLHIDFTSPAGGGGPFRELWFQWWQRYGPGLRPQNSGSSYRGNGQWSYVKDMAFNNASEERGRVEFGWSQGGGGQWGLATTADGGEHYRSNLVDTTWRKVQGGIPGSGKWNKYQVHVKADTGRFDGVYEAWVDGVKIASHTKVRYSGGDGTWTGWRTVRVANNQSSVGSDSDLAGSYSDYDDIKVSVAGYITQD